MDKSVHKKLSQSEIYIEKFFVDFKIVGENFLKWCNVIKKKKYKNCERKKSSEKKFMYHGKKIPLKQDKKSKDLLNLMFPMQINLKENWTEQIENWGRKITF